ncbi:MAG: ribbon-helix-helix domain-containing protein [Chrysiogenetes bacterium]|nr:ribbon-helix-helix domain-containing protein [Chrysiogenetes bacterium]
MASNKVSTTVYLERAQDERLKALSKRTRVPVAEYIRQGVDLVLQRYQDQIPGQQVMLPLDDRNEKAG